MKIKKLNSFGFSHHVILVAFVVVFAVVGVGYLVASHANPAPRKLYEGDSTKVKGFSITCKKAPSTLIASGVKIKCVKYNGPVPVD